MKKSKRQNIIIDATAIIKKAKQELRITARKHRQDLFKDRPTAADKAAFVAASNFVKNNELKSGQCIACYWSIGDEISTAPLLDILLQSDVVIALPKIPPEPGPLIFKKWQTGTKMVKAKFGLMEPSGEAETLRPEIIVMPLLAFDKAGNRLGYGGGYYDRSLSALTSSAPKNSSNRIKTIGFAYDGQEVNAIPTDDLDHRLDELVTEKRYIDF